MTETKRLALELLEKWAENTTRLISVTQATPGKKAEWRRQLAKDEADYRARIEAAEPEGT
jgi:hypothetical protein